MRAMVPLLLLVATLGAPAAGAFSAWSCTSDYVPQGYVCAERDATGAFVTWHAADRRECAHAEIDRAGGGRLLIDATPAPCLLA